MCVNHVNKVDLFKFIISCDFQFRDQSAKRYFYPLYVPIMSWYFEVPLSDRMDFNGVYNEARPLKWSPIVSRLLLTMSHGQNIKDHPAQHPRNTAPLGSHGIASKSNSMASF